MKYKGYKIGSRGEYATAKKGTRIILAGSESQLTRKIDEILKSKTN